MYKFKIGDLVTGNSESRYAITNSYSICKIISIKEHLYEDLMVQVVHHKESKEYIGEVYSVRSGFFSLYREPNNFRRVMNVPSR